MNLGSRRNDPCRIYIDTWTITSVRWGVSTDLSTRYRWNTDNRLASTRRISDRSMPEHAPGVIYPAICARVRGAYGHYNAPVIIYEAWLPGFPGVAIYRHPAEFLPLATGYHP